MSDTTFFFAGGGTGGHIYPLLSIAEQILARRPDAGIHFFHSTRSVDQRVFEKIPYERTPLPATGLSFHPVKLLRFISTFRQSYRQARDRMAASSSSRRDRSGRVRRGPRLSGWKQAGRARGADQRGPAARPGQQAQCPLGGRDLRAVRGEQEGVQAQPGGRQRRRLSLAEQLRASRSRQGDGGTRLGSQQERPADYRGVERLDAESTRRSANCCRNWRSSPTAGRSCT